jgi:hypothetical protein
MVTPARGSRVSRLLQWQRRDAIIIEREAVARLDAERRSSREPFDARRSIELTIIELSKVRRHGKIRRSYGTAIHGHRPPTKLKKKKKKKKKNKREHVVAWEVERSIARGAFYAKRSGETDPYARFETRAHTERLFKARTLPFVATEREYVATAADLATNGFSRNDVTGAVSSARERVPMRRRSIDERDRRGNLIRGEFVQPSSSRQAAAKQLE